MPPLDARYENIAPNLTSRQRAFWGPHLTARLIRGTCNSCGYWTEMCFSIQTAEAALLEHYKEWHE